MRSNLPLQVLLYFNGWYDLLYTLVMLLLFIWKGTALPYPGPLQGLLALEVCLVLLLAGMEYARVMLASRGNKAEQSGPLVFSLLIAFPAAYLFFYFLYQQVYVTRLDLILAWTGLGFIVLEMLLSMLVLLTLLRSPAPAGKPAAGGAAQPLRSGADGGSG